MKKLRVKLLAVLIITALLFPMALSASAAAESPLTIFKDLEPYRNVAPNEQVTLSFEVSGGNGAISYEWYSNAGKINWTSSSITFTVSSNDKIYCVARSGRYTVTSTECVLNVTSSGGNVFPTATPALDSTAPVTPPQIVTQPKNTSVALGQTATLSVQATCAWQNQGVTLEYQWYCNTTTDMRYSTPISGATSPTYTVPVSYAPSKLYYICAIHSTNGVDKSQDVLTDVVYVYSGEMNITKHPTGETVTAGGKATFIARADGAASFQWRIVKNDGSNSFIRADEAPSYINGLQVYGANTDTLVLSNIPASMNGMSIICVFYADAARTQFKITNAAKLTVSNPYTPTAPAASSYIPGAATTATPTAPAATAIPSANATILAPTISVQPEGAVVADGQTASLLVVAVDDNTSGTQLKYQWYKNDKNSNANGTAIAGAQAATYTPDSIAGSKYYYVGVWATDGTKTSKVVYSSPAAVTYTAAVTASPSPSPTPTPAPSRGNDKSLLSQLALPLIAMLVAAAVGIGAFIVLKKSSADDNDYRGRGKGKGRRSNYGGRYDDDYDDYDDYN